MMTMQRTLLFATTILLLLATLSVQAQESATSQRSDVDLKRSMMWLTDRMHEIVVNINSVGDVQVAEPHITRLFDKLIEDAKSALQNGASLEAINDENDPEVKAANERMEVAMTNLEERSPEAAVALEEILKKGGMRLMTVAMMQTTSEDFEIVQDKSSDEGSEGLDDEVSSIAFADHSAPSVEAPAMRAATVTMVDELSALLSSIDDLEDFENSADNFTAIFDRLGSDLMSAMRSGETLFDLSAVLGDADHEDIRQVNERYDAALAELRDRDYEAALLFDEQMQAEMVRVIEGAVLASPDFADEPDSDDIDALAE